MTEGISVIIRCKDEERWIGYAVQSVIDFIPKNEIIVINNKSRDRSIEVIKSFRRDPDLRSNNENYTEIIIQDVNDYSPGAVLNKGVELANFEKILVLSAHCVITHFDYSKLSQNLEKYAAIFGNQIPIYEGKKITKRYLWSHFCDSQVDNMYSKSEDRYFFHNAASIFNKCILKQHKFNENIVGKEDRYWANNIVEVGKTYLYDPLNFCVEHHYTANGNTWKGVG